jgi:hypothetical protein
MARSIAALAFGLWVAACAERGHGDDKDAAASVRGESGSRAANTGGTGPPARGSVGSEPAHDATARTDDGATAASDDAGLATSLTVDAPAEDADVPEAFSVTGSCVDGEAIAVEVADVQGQATCTAGRYELTIALPKETPPGKALLTASTAGGERVERVIHYAPYSELAATFLYDTPFRTRPIRSQSSSATWPTRCSVGVRARSYRSRASTTRF